LVLHLVLMYFQKAFRFCLHNVVIFCSLRVSFLILLWVDLYFKNTLLSQVSCMCSIVDCFRDVFLATEFSGRIRTSSFHEYCNLCFFKAVGCYLRIFFSSPFNIWFHVEYFYGTGRQLYLKSHINFQGLHSVTDTRITKHMHKTVISRNPAKTVSAVITWFIYQENSLEVQNVAAI